MKQNAILFDVDGVLLNTPNWEDEFPGEEFCFARWAMMAKNKQHLNQFGIDLLHGFHESVFKWKKYPEILILTGRNESFRTETYHAIDHALEFKPFKLFMRPNDQSFADVPDHEFKEEVLRRDIMPYYDVLVAVDDRLSIVDMYQANGVPAIMMANHLSKTR